MSKPKIVHLVNQWEFDGTSQVVENLLGATEFEHEIVSITPKIERHAVAKTKYNYKLSHFDFRFDKDYSGLNYLRHSLNNRRLLKESVMVRDYLQRLRPEIVHAHLQPRELVIAKKLKSNPKLIYTDHSVRIYKGQYGWLNESILAMAYREFYAKYNVVAVSPVVRECHEQFNLLDTQRIHKVIINAVELPERRETRRQDEELRVIYVARLVERKGHELLFESWSKISKQGIKLQLIGGGPRLHKLKELARKLKIDHSVEFIGEVNDVNAYLINADIAVFPSEQEGLPIALLEKMAIGLPVVASDIPAIKCFLEHEKEGLLFKSNIEEDLTIRLSQLMKDAKLRKHLGNAARKKVAEQFNLTPFLRNYNDFYFKVLNR